MMRLRRTPDSNGNTVNPYRDWEPVNPTLPVYDASGDQVGFTREDAAHAAFLQTFEATFDDAHASFLQISEERKSAQIAFQELYVHELEQLAHQHIQTAYERALEQQM